MPDPDPTDGILDNVIEVPTDSETDGGDDMPGEVEPGNLQVALTAMANEAGAASGRRLEASDQLSADSQRMWTIAMTTPTVMMGHGMRVASESGSGRTRAETNNPRNTSAPGADGNP